MDARPHAGQQTGSMMADMELDRGKRGRPDAFRGQQAGSMRADMEPRLREEYGSAP